MNVLCIGIELRTRAKTPRIAQFGTNMQTLWAQTELFRPAPWNAPSQPLQGHPQTPDSHLQIDAIFRP